MNNKKIIEDCSHISFTDWGVYACKLYDPYLSEEKSIVTRGTCAGNEHCPYKQTQLLKTENHELTTKLDFTTRQYEALQKKYAEVLRLAKENADSYEYCMKNLEEEIARLKNER